MLWLDRTTYIYIRLHELYSASLHASSFVVALRSSICFLRRLKFVTGEIYGKKLEWRKEIHWNLLGFVKADSRRSTVCMKYNAYAPYTNLYCGVGLNLRSRRNLTLHFSDSFRNSCDVGLLVCAGHAWLCEQYKRYISCKLYLKCQHIFSNPQISHNTFRFSWKYDATFIFSDKHHAFNSRDAILLFIDF